jgi:hypothetical protein
LGAPAAAAAVDVGDARVGVERVGVDVGRGVDVTVGVGTVAAVDDATGTFVGWIDVAGVDVATRIATLVGEDAPPLLPHPASPRAHRATRHR